MEGGDVFGGSWRHEVGMEMAVNAGVNFRELVAWRVEEVWWREHPLTPKDL